MPKSDHRAYGASPDTVYRAAITAITTLGYQVLNSDAASHIISFNTGLSMRSWSGQNMSVVIREERGGSAVTVAGGLAKRGTFVTGGQIGSLGETGSVMRKFFDALV